MTENQTILIVDDEEDIRKLFTLVLETVGVTVVTAANAPAALRILATHPVDLLVTDYHMPGMTGVQLIETVHEMYPGLPTILASGQMNVKVFAQSCGARAYYRKGTPIRQLIDTVSAVLNSDAQQQGNTPPLH